MLNSAYRQHCPLSIVRCMLSLYVPVESLFACMRVTNEREKERLRRMLVFVLGIEVTIVCFFRMCVFIHYVCCQYVRGEEEHKNTTFLNRSNKVGCYRCNNGPDSSNCGSYARVSTALSEHQIDDG